MAIVLNEYEWAERMITDRKLGNKPGETLSRVAKYYFENRYSKREVRKLLDQFLMQCNPDASLVHWSETLDKIVKAAQRYPLIQIDHVYISEKELEKISTLSSRQLRRLAFTMLCVVKYWNAISPNNNCWLNTTDREIFQMANINVPSNRHDLMYGELREAGFIRLSKKIDNLNVQILFVDESEEENDGGLYIKDYRNLGHQYMRHLGEPFYECENCGIVVRNKTASITKDPRKGSCSRAGGRPPKYCPACAAEIRIKQNVNAVMKHRDTYYI